MPELPGKRFVGKTVERVDGDEHDEFLLLTFTDGSNWLILETVTGTVAGPELLQVFGKPNEPKEQT